jgi:DNA primase
MSALTGAVKTSGAKSLHMFVPIDVEASLKDSVAATRAIATRDRSSTLSTKSFADGVTA